MAPSTAMTSTVPRGGRRGRGTAYTIMILGMLTFAGCAGPRVGAPPATATTPPPAEVTTPAAPAAPPDTVAPGSAAPAGTHLAASTSVTTSARYTFDLAFDISVDTATTEDTESAAPGQADVTWTATIDGTLTVTNTTGGHKLPLGEWLTWSCGADATHCLSLYGFWPITSPVCTTKTVDPTGYYAYVTFAESVVYGSYVYPPGPDKWCVLKFGQATSITGDSLPPAGTASTGWAGATESVVLKDEKAYPALAAALAAGPKAWIVASVTWAGEKTRQTPAGCDGGAETVFWSSTTATCLRS